MTWQFNAINWSFYDSFGPDLDEANLHWSPSSLCIASTDWSIMWYPIQWSGRGIHILNIPCIFLIWGAMGSYLEFPKDAFGAKRSLQASWSALTSRLVLTSPEPGRADPTDDRKICWNRMPSDNLPYGHDPFSSMIDLFHMIPHGNFLCRELLLHQRVNLLKGDIKPKLR